MHDRDDNYDLPGDGKPKYVDEYRRIEIGAPMLRSLKLSVDAVCGTYDWICHWDILFDNVYHSNSSDEVNGGFLTLSVKPGCDICPENIHGSIRIWVQNGTIESMIACPVANNWDFDVKWEDGAAEKQEEGHGIEVLDVLDDQGNYFLMFLYDGGSLRGCGQHYSKFIGKKRNGEGSEKFLTRAEWESRVAMVKKDPQTMRRLGVNKKKWRMTTFL